MLSDKQIADVLRGLPPDADDKTVVGAMRSAESGTPLEHIWAAVNKPLAGSADALVPALRHEHGPDEGGLRRTAEDFGASLTSPLSLATTAAGVGAGIAGKAGKFGISNAARGVEAALQAPLAAEGLHNVVEADSPGQALAGAAESALALHGMTSAARRLQPSAKVFLEPERTGLNPAFEPRPGDRVKPGIPLDIPEAPRHEVFPQGDELVRPIAADTPSSTPQSASSPRIGTADAAQSSVELSPELGQIVNDLHTEHGGSTFNLSAKKNLVGEPFYAISPYQERGEILDRQPTPQDFNRFIHKNLDLLQKPDHSIGTWFNPEDQKHYLDVSITEPSRERALALGKQHNQLAVFDLKNLDTIPIEGTTGKPIESATAKPIESATSLASPLAAVKQGAKLLDQGVSPADLKPALLKAGAPSVSIDKIVAAARKLHLQHAVSR